MKKNIALALLTGIIFALALPPFKTGFLAYIALIPFFLLLENKNIKEAFRWGYVTGLFITITTLFWIGWVTLPGAFGVLLVWPLAIAVYAVLHTLLFNVFSSYAFAALPFVWTTIEYLESISELAFPWNYIGYTQSYYLPFIQYAEFTSIYGVSFWVVLLNVLFFLLWKNFRSITKSVAIIFATLILFFAPFQHGTRILADRKESADIKISLIQGNRDPNEKWNGGKESNYAVYERLTKNVLAQEPDLVIWPETAMPMYLRSESSYIQKIHQLIDSSGTSLITGAIDYEYLEDGSYEHFNSAFFFEPNYYTMQRYAKMKLVPFSEKVPYKHHFPFNILKELFSFLALGDYALGKEVGTLQGQFRSTLKSDGDPPKEYDYKTGVAICYESVFPDHVRKYVNRGADFLIIITNDAWFGKTSAPFQHTQIAVFRAIENRRDIARCANTGISCFIDRYGHVSQETALYEEAVITDSVQLNEKKTFYTIYGNIFAIFVSIVTLLTVVLALFKKLFFKVIL